MRKLFQLSTAVCLSVCLGELWSGAGSKGWQFISRRVCARNSDESWFSVAASLHPEFGGISGEERQLMLWCASRNSDTRLG